MSTTTNEKFSVIIPTYNRLPLLRRTLESLFRQRYPDFEIIVVNDGSTDGTHDYLDSCAQAGSILYLQQQNQGPARARNRGIECASGTYIAFIDDDCIAPDDWLMSYQALLLAHNDLDGIGGGSETGDPSNPFAEANDHIVNFLKAALNTSDDVTLPFLTSNNAVYKAASVRAIGGFDRQFTIGAEERDLNFRLVQNGGKLAYTPSITIKHYNDARFLAFLRHQYDQGKGSYLLYKNAMARFGKQPPRIPPHVYLDLLLSPFGSRPLGRASVLSALIVLAQAAVTAGYLLAAFQGRKEGERARTGEHNG